MYVLSYAYKINKNNINFQFGNRDDYNFIIT